MNITIFGVGYVGLVTGTCLADVGHHVVCVDVDAQKMQSLQSGIIPIYEPGLQPMVQTNQRAGRLLFTTSAAKAVAHAQLIFIAVGTPPGEDGSADLHHVLDVAHTIASHMQGEKIVAGKSTVPVGTADQVRAAIAQTLQARGVEWAFDVCSNPEFLKEGDAIADFTKPARIIIGTNSPNTEAVMRECYAPYNRNHDRIIVMDVRSAELTKYAANAMLATKISFMNEMANLAEHLGADIEQVRLGIGADPRIGYQFIYPGAGFGGSCFPKDVRALAHTARGVGHEPRLLQAVQDVNHAQKQTLFAKLETALGSVQGKTIAVWGLAFKPETDDVREAPSQVLIHAILQAGGRVQAYDPQAMTHAAQVFAGVPGIQFMPSETGALGGADALVICTEWKAFRAFAPATLKQQLKTPVVVDGRNLYDPAVMQDVGLEYWGVGRGESIQMNQLPNRR